MPTHSAVYLAILDAVVRDHGGSLEYVAGAGRKRRRLENEPDGVVRLTNLGPDFAGVTYRVERDEEARHILHTSPRRQLRAWGVLEQLERLHEERHRAHQSKGGFRPSVSPVPTDELPDEAAPERG